MLKEGGADNPFAALGAAMVSSFSIEPGVIMWILMVVGVIGLVFQFIGKERVSTEVQSPMQKKIILAIISVIALLVLIIVLLNTTFKDKKIYVSTNDKENYAATVNTDCKNAYTASVAFTVDHPEAREITLDNIKNSGYIQTAGVTTKVYNLDGTSGTITCSGQTDWGVGAAVITINNGVMTLTPSKIGGPPAPVPAPKAAPSVGVMSPEEWLNKAVALFSDGKCTDPNKAFEYINEAIRLNPDYAEAYYFRGAVYDTLGDYNQSIANYNKAIELNSQFPTFYNNLGFAYQKLGNTEEAVKNLKIAASQGVKNAQDYLNSEGISW